MSRNGPGVFIFPFLGLALYFYSSSLYSSSHLAMDMERNSSISLHHGFMTDLYRNLFMGLDRIWNLDLDLDLLRFHLLLLKDCALLLFVSFYLGSMHARARARARPLSEPFPPQPIPQVFHQSWHHIHISAAAATTTRSSTYPYPIPSCDPSFRDTHQYLPNQCQKIALEPLSHILHFSSSFFCFISIMLQREGCIYCTYILVRRIFFRCILGVDMRNSNCTFWTLDLVIGLCVHWQDQCCHRDPTVS